MEIESPAIAIIKPKRRYDAKLRVKEEQMAEEFRPTMNLVRVDKDGLLEILRKNRGAHRKIFLEAIEVYRKRATDALEEMLDDAKNGHKIDRSIGLIEPVDYTKEYDRVIKTLEMSMDSVIYLDQRDIARFIQDDWDWRENFTTSTAAYLAQTM